MPWIHFAYSEETKLRAHICHPGIAFRRIAEICDKFGEQPRLQEEIPHARMDCGGMIFSDDKRVRIALDPDRSVAIYEHHAEAVIDAIRKANRFQNDGVTYLRFWSWPNTIFYISEADGEAITKALQPIAAKEIAEAHRERVVGALNSANAFAANVTKHHMRQEERTTMIDSAIRIVRECMKTSDYNHMTPRQKRRFWCGLPGTLFMLWAIRVAARI